MPFCHGRCTFLRRCRSGRPARASSGGLRDAAVASRARTARRGRSRWWRRSFSASRLSLWRSGRRSAMSARMVRFAPGMPMVLEISATMRAFLIELDDAGSSGSVWFAGRRAAMVGSLPCASRCCLAGSMSVSCSLAGRRACARGLGFDGAWGVVVRKPRDAGLRTGQA